MNWHSLMADMHHLIFPGMIADLLRAPARVNQNLKKIPIFLLDPVCRNMYIWFLWLEVSGVQVLMSATLTRSLEDTYLAAAYLSNAIKVALMR